MHHVRIILTGMPEAVDVASEVLCVISTASRATTRLLPERPGYLQRHFLTDFDPRVLADLGVLDVPLLMR